VRLRGYLDAEGKERAARDANAWVKSLRHARADGASFRERFTYLGDSLWWFAELYLHKRRTINDALAVRRAVDALIARHAPGAMRVIRGDDIVRTVVAAVGVSRGIPVIAHRPGPADWRNRFGSSVLPAIYAFSPLFKRTRNLVRPRTPAWPVDVDVVVFVHSAFWRRDTGDDTYVGPLVDALRESFGPKLAIVSLGPPTTFRVRTWGQRFKELWRERVTPDAGDHPVSIEAFSSVRSLAGSRRVWRERRRVGRRLLASTGLRQASTVDGVDLWPVLAGDFEALATLQAPWSARAMDEAAAALEALRPRVIVTYAEAGGWGRALVLEARRREMASVGLQHGFISRHWLNYLHEPDEIAPSSSSSADRGFPMPTVTLLYDDFAREHLETRGRFPPDTLRVVGNPRLEAITAAAKSVTRDDMSRVRASAGAAPGQHLVLLAIKYRPAWDETLRALMAAIASMSDVHLAVRPHPGDAPTSYDRFLSGVSNARVVSRTLDPVALMSAARLIVTINSTVAIEAIPLGVPALAMRLPNYLTPFVEAGAMEGTSAPTEIGPALNRLVRDEAVRAALLETARRFLERYRMVPDGHAADRTVQAVRDLIVAR
jgi:hypothetical protein